MFLALVHFRYEFQDEGNYAAFGLSMLPLPESDYLQKIEQPPPTPENGHEGAGAAGAASSADSPGVQQPESSSSESRSLHQGGSSIFSSGGGAGAAAATKLCDASLPLPGSSSVRSSVTSTASSLSAVGPAATANGGGARRGSGDFGGGDFQPLPPLDAMHQQVGSFPLQGPRADAWGIHDMAGAVSVGDTGRGLDDSLNSSRGSANGGGGSGGGGEGFQDGIGGGVLELDSGRGGLSSGFVRASSRGEMRIAGGL